MIIRWLVLMLLVCSTAEASNVACFLTGKTPFYKKSVHTPDYSSNPNCLINPIVPNTFRRYWKRVGNLVVEMIQTEKDAVDLAEQTARDDAELIRIDNLDVTVEDLLVALIKRINVRIPSNPIKRQEIVDQIKNDKGL